MLPSFLPFSPSEGKKEIASVESLVFTAEPRQSHRRQVHITGEGHGRDFEGQTTNTRPDIKRSTMGGKRGKRERGREHSHPGRKECAPVHTRKTAGKAPSTPL